MPEDIKIAATPQAWQSSLARGMHRRTSQSSRGSKYTYRTILSVGWERMHPLSWDDGIVMQQKKGRPLWYDPASPPLRWHRQQSSSALTETWQKLNCRPPFTDSMQEYCDFSLVSDNVALNSGARFIQQGVLMTCGVQNCSVKFVREWNWLPKDVDLPLLGQIGLSLP